MRSRSWSIGAPALLAALALCAWPARADLAVLEADRDTTLYAESGDLGNGSGDHLFVGVTNTGAARRALLRFDVAGALPPGSTVEQATLTLSMSRTIVGDEPVELRFVLADWGEGAADAPGSEGQGAPAEPGDATWTSRFHPGSPWATPGGDVLPAPSATTPVGGTGSYEWTDPAMAADVQLWLDSPALNAGWLLLGDESGGVSTKRFDSRDHPLISNWPRLTIRFSPPPVDGACCSDAGCESLTREACAERDGTYLGAGTTCEGAPCLLPRGGCCDEDGGCAELPGAYCPGLYLGDGAACGADACPQPVGACCGQAGSCEEATAAGCAAAGGLFQGGATACADVACPVVLEPFVDALTIPPVAEPVSGSVGGEATYEIRMLETTRKMHRDLPPTRIWGYEGLYPGPTIEAARNRPVTVRWANELRDEDGALRTEHYLPVDLCPHGPDHEGPNPRAVVHLHGAHVEAEFDGHPEDTILPGEDDVYVYGNRQLPATLWYHDHALGITRLNVYLGLGAFYIIRDEYEQTLGLPDGEYEVPLLIADRTFDADGSLRYPAAWQEHVFGDTILVNGTVWPYLDVRRGKYRLRLLNGSNARTLTLGLSNGMPLTMIGGDGGLLEAPVALSSVTLGPAERADVVVDFAGAEPGSEILLLNSAPAPFPGTPGVGVVPEVMKFVVGDGTGHLAPLPATLRPLERLDESDAIVEREFELRRTADACTGASWRINGLGWDDITEFPQLDTTEVWTFVNPTPLMHPMHMHLVMFQVLDRQPFEEVDFQVVPTGPRVPPPAEESGWKDTVQVQPNEIVRVIARFEGYTGLFAYHCHILEHEDHEMMRQFRTVQCGNGVVEPTETCDDGNGIGLDGCSKGCRVEGFLLLSGIAAGGEIALRVDGVLIEVVTLPGQTAPEVLAAIAAAIEQNPILHGRGVGAEVIDAGLVTGAITGVEIDDPGLRQRDHIRLGAGELTVASGDPASIAVTSGDLVALRASGGDFAVASDGCHLVDGRSTGVDDVLPAPGGGVWFLVRDATADGGGSYDTGLPSQVRSRDEGIAAAGHDCR